MNERITLALGCLSDKIADQLTAQGCPFDPAVIGHLQLDADAASRIRVRGIITEAQGDRAYDRISDRVFKHLEEFARKAAA